MMDITAPNNPRSSGYNLSSMKASLPHPSPPKKTQVLATKKINQIGISLASGIFQLSLNCGAPAVTLAITPAIAPIVLP